MTHYTEPLQSAANSANFVLLYFGTYKFCTPFCWLLFRFMYLCLTFYVVTLLFMFMFYVLCLVYCLLCTVVGMRGKGNFGPLYVCTYIGLTIKLSDSDSEEVWQPGLQRRLHSQRLPLCHEEPWHRLGGGVPLYGQSEWVFHIDKGGGGIPI